MSDKITSEMLAQGAIVREPVGNEQGYWVGCPAVTWDETDQAAYLCYRIRRPRGVQPDRGGEVRICKTTDFENYEDVWSMTKDQLGTSSIERNVVRRGDDGNWRYFSSYVDPADGRWQTCVIKGGSDIASLDPANMQPIFKAGDLGLEGVKDPWLMKVGDTYHLILSIAVATETTGGGSHETHDIFNTGECVSATGLATSKDLDNWEWQGVIFRPEGPGWDQYCRRINSIIEKNGKYYAFYDGSAGHHENYEEKCAFAVSDDLKNWTTLSADGPALLSPHASTSLRYMDYLQHDGTLRLFYEWAREDGAHNMRSFETSLDALPFG